jgi:tetratricopeptide (TPR) repeat protein
MKKFFLYFAIFILGSCAANYKSIIRDTEKLYYSGNYKEAIPKIRTLATEADSKDQLLYLMEAGMIFHTQGDYESSNKAFKEAEGIADTIKTSVTKTGLSFLLSDNESNFKGEDFERVLIKFYIALNFIFLGDYDTAKIYFRRLDVELREMKFTEGKYKQNLCARYLDGILSETLGRYNDARVQYKNIYNIDPSFNSINGDRYVLAVKENDARDMASLSEFKRLVDSLDRNMNPVPYEKTMGEVIIINQAGKAATKESRGKILDDELFAGTLRAAIQTAVVSKGSGVTASGVIAGMSMAENPIPIYEERDPESAKPRSVLVNGKKIGSTIIYNNYSETAIQSFNENYTSIIAKNATSIAIKMVTAAVAAEAASRTLSAGKKKTEQQQLIDGIIRLAAGAAAGYAVSQTVAPDLRSWRLLPSNYQIKRLYLKPGDYTIELPGAKLPDGNSKAKVTVESGQPVFLNFRSFKPE